MKLFKLKGNFYVLNKIGGVGPIKEDKKAWYFSVWSHSGRHFPTPEFETKEAARIGHLRLVAALEGA